MKGIILAGGSGTRLYPITQGVSKQLLPIYDKPMIYYPLSVLMLANIRDILIITTPEDQESFQRLLDDGSRLGINLEYAIQEKPNGLAEAFIIGEKFIGNDSTCLVLGDNIFYGSHLTEVLRKNAEIKKGASIFSYWVKNPQAFGIVETDAKGNITSVEEKPSSPKSNYAITGLYFYDNQVVKMAKTITPSHRGELEITAINELYLQKKQLRVEKLARGCAWLDTGTHESLLEASHFIQTLEKHQSFKVACLEEIAYNNKWLSKKQIQKAVAFYKKTQYGEYLQRLIK